MQWELNHAGLSAFESVAGIVPLPDANLLSGREPQLVRRRAVTANLLATLGVRPQLGRDISETEDVPGGPQVALISDRLWRSQFNADPKLIEKQITLSGSRYTVVGVLPAGFLFPDASLEPDILSPAALFSRNTQAEDIMATPVKVICKLRKGVTYLQAQSEVSAFLMERARIHPYGSSLVASSQAVSVRPLKEYLTGDDRKPLLLLFGAALCVLLVTCANVANLQMASAATRSHEIAIREALGATRSRLIRQFFVENLILSALSTVLGFLLVLLFLHMTKGADPFASQSSGGPFSDPMLNSFYGKSGGAYRIGLPIFLFSIALSLLTTFLFGLAPALRASNPRSFVGLQLNSGRLTAGPSTRRLRQMLLVFEIAASIALLSCSGLLVRSFTNLMSYATGFDPQDTMTATLLLQGSRYHSAGSVRSFSENLLPRLQALPGVQAAALSSTLPLDSTFALRFSLAEDPNPPFDSGHIVTSIFASPDYFRAVGTPLVGGRPFGGEDTASSPRVLIVNRSLARRFFGGSALGDHIYVRDMEREETHFVSATIVGVAEDVPHDGLLEEIKPEVYIPLEQGYPTELHIALRSTGPSKGLANGIAKAVSATDIDIPVSHIETMDERLHSLVSQRKSTAGLMASFAALTIVLAIVGVFGVFAYTVSQRTRELGIRVALGASRFSLVRLIVGEASTVIGVGGAVGLFAAFVSSRFVASMLVEVGQHDPLIVSTAFVSMTLVAIFASAVPAVRACCTDLLSVLREE